MPSRRVPTNSPLSLHSSRRKGWFTSLKSCVRKTDGSVHFGRRQITRRLAAVDIQTPWSARSVNCRQFSCAWMKTSLSKAGRSLPPSLHSSRRHYRQPICRSIALTANFNLTAVRTVAKPNGASVTLPPPLHSSRRKNRSTTKKWCHTPSMPEPLATTKYGAQAASITVTTQYIRFPPPSSSRHRRSQSHESRHTGRARNWTRGYLG